MVKVRFKNGISGNWVDLSSDPLSSLCGLGTLKRRVESRNKGEAGVIGLDSASMTFYNTPGGTIYNAFNGDLSSVQRYIFEILTKKSTGEEVKVYEGVADFSTIKRPDFEAKISFNVVDKLSALNLVTNSATRETFYLWYRLGNPNAEEYKIEATRGQYYFYDEEQGTIYFDISHLSTGLHIDCPAEVFNVGEIIKLGDSCFYVTRYYREEVVVYNPDQTLLESYQRGIAVVIPTDEIPYYTVILNSTLIYGHLFNGVDIVDKVFDGQYIRSIKLDAIKILQSIVKKVWDDLVTVNETGLGSFPLSYSYLPSLIDENPFGMHPLEAVKMLANSMQVYVFFNRAGSLVIKKKSNLINGTRRTFNPVLKHSGVKSDFWDRLVDAVTVVAKSTTVVDGEALTGTATVTKYSGIKPRNERKLEVFAPFGIQLTIEALNEFALSVATDEIQFYGKRHDAYNITSGLLEEMLDWDLTDIVTISDVDYYLETINLELFSPEIQFDAVSVNGYDYDSQQIQIALSKEAYASVNSISTGSGVYASLSSSADQPYLSFTYQNINEGNIVAAEMRIDEILEEVILVLLSTFNPLHLTQFRLFDDEGDDLLLLSEIPFGMTKKIRPFKKPIMKVYGAKQKIYMQILGENVANSGNGFVVFKKFRKGEMK